MDMIPIQVALKGADAVHQYVRVIGERNNLYEELKRKDNGFRYAADKFRAYNSQSVMNGTGAEEMEFMLKHQKDRKLLTEKIRAYEEKVKELERIDVGEG